jgi:hypothetical protein
MILLWLAGAILGTAWMTLGLLLRLLSSLVVFVVRCAFSLIVLVVMAVVWIVDLSAQILAWTVTFVVMLTIRLIVGPSPPPSNALAGWTDDEMAPTRQISFPTLSTLSSPPARRNPYCQGMSRPIPSRCPMPTGPGPRFPATSISPRN